MVSPGSASSQTVPSEGRMSRNPTERRVPPQAAWSFDSHTSFVASPGGQRHGRIGEILIRYFGRDNVGVPRPDPVYSELRPSDGPRVPRPLRRVVSFQVPVLRSAAVRARRLLPPGRRGGQVVGPPPSIGTHKTLLVLYSCGGDGVKHPECFSDEICPRRTSTLTPERGCE